MPLKINDEFRRDFLVSEKVYTAFTDAFNDRNALHVDDGYAKTHGYQSKVMHGNILGGFLSYFVGEGLPVRNTVIVTQEIKFRNAFYLQDTLAFKATLVEAHESVSAYIFKFAFSRGDILIADGRLQIGMLA